MASDSSQPCYEFGPFRVDARNHLLLREGQPVPLSPKAFEVLLVLLEHRGRVLEKDELIERLWPDSVVEEANLTVNISALRKALGESRNHPQYIVTVPGRGYRFAAEVKEVSEPTTELVVQQRASASLVIEEEESESSAADFTQESAAARRGGASSDSVAQSWSGRIKRHKLGVGLALVALMAVAGVSFAYLHRRPALTEKDTVLLADFENQTGDVIFDGTLKQALAVQLEQSPFLNIFPDERVRETLRLMKRPADERVTSAVAREVCQRQNLKAMLSGSIASLGHDYVLTLEAINSQTGDVIAREQVEAGSKEQVLRALGQAATKLREKLGESLHLIQQFDVPIAQATTSSLEALKAYSLGYEQNLKGKYLEAIPFYKRAIELDPNFVLAYSTLSGAYSNTLQLELAAECAEKAYQLRERVSERERLSVSGRYYLSGTQDMDKAMEVFEVWKRTYPRSFTPVNNLAFAYLTTGQYGQAIEEAREAIQLNPTPSQPYANLGRALVRLDRYTEAQEVFERALARNIGSSAMHSDLYALAFIRGDATGMKKQLDWWTGRPNEYAALEVQGDTAAFQGRWRQAREFARRALDLEQHRGLKEIASISVTWGALKEALLGQCQSVPKETSEGLAIERNVRSLRASARALAICGEASQAQALAEELARRSPKDTVIQAIWLPVIRAAVETQRGNPAAAIQSLQATSRYEAAAEFWPASLRGQAYLRLRAGREAMAEFQKILDHRGQDPLSPLYPLAHLELARAAALAGDVAQSRKAYEDFLALWKDADPELPILIEAKKEYERLK